MKDRRVLDAAVTYLSSRITRRPEVALILGSGLGDFAANLSNPVEVPARAIPSYPASTVEGHEGSLIFGTLRSNGQESLPILIFKGRIHFYESGDLEETTFPVHVAHELGAKVLLVTNAAGGINPSFSEGDLMLVDELINFSFLNPQWKVEAESISPFSVKTGGYFDKLLSRAILDSGSKLGMKIQHGSYCYLKGPSYETKAEIEMLRRIGADAVGMSTFPEVVTASKLGMRVAALSLISNLAAGLSEERLSHKDVAETASRVREVFSTLLFDAILRIRD